MSRVNFFYHYIVKGEYLWATKKHVAFMSYIPMPIHVCLRVHVSIDWSNICIKNISHRAILTSFESYIGHMTCQHIIHQLDNK